MSVNSLYYGNKRFGMRKDAKEWQQRVFYQLSQYEAELANLRDSFKIGKNGYKVHVDYVFPRNILYNKAGAPSSKAQDLSNCDKALIDCLFLPANFGNNVPYNCQNLNMDDKHLFELSSRKLAGNSYQIKITVEIINLP